VPPCPQCDELVNSNLEHDRYLDKAIKDVHKRIDKRAGETKDLKKEMRASVLGNNQGIEMLEGRIDVLDEDAATFQIQLALGARCPGNQWEHLG